MDTSNPVIVGERTTMGDFRNENLLLKRQDYKLLQELVRDGQRVPPEKFSVEQEEVEERLLKELEVSGVMEGGKGEVFVPMTAVLEQVLVSKYHPQGIRMDGAHVSVQRTFPQRKRIRQMVRALLAYNPNAAAQIEKVTYSGGTKRGFSTRLKKWSERRPQMMIPILKQWGFDGFDVLKKRMPFKSGALLDWNQGLQDLVNKVTINKTSGAGPPFFQPKYRCLDEINQAIEEIAKHISEGKCEQFFHENPEFILSECKNKMDRYEIGKIQDKTRPYWSFSAPVSVLISILCQDFCANLYTFNTNKKSANAYGFSYAHGGGKAMWDWMQSTEEGEMKYVVYGDDTKMVWRKNGKLYEVNPDFEQMDGSIDRDTVKITVDWIYGAYSERHGENSFFRYICDLWIMLACGSKFFVDGKKVYQNQTGLLTGVVGTTLFDTVKSVLAYHLYVHTKHDPFEKEKSHDFFRNMGLKVKDGTWEPVFVMEEPEEGGYASEEKFLGARLIYIQGAKELEPVPYIDEEDLVALVGNLRQQNLEKNTTLLKRRLFDSARGYMITGAYHHPRIWNSMTMIIEETPSEIVVQRVQAGSGKGEGPELDKMIDEDFEWPSSDGYPTVKFCKNVYLSEGNTFQEDGLWTVAFPDLKVHLKDFRSKKERMPIGKVKGTDWGDQQEFDELVEKGQDLINPPERVENNAVLTNEKFRLPKNFSVFRKLNMEDKMKKEARLWNIVEVMEIVHHQFLNAALPYGGFYITTWMMGNGWFPTANGYWTRDETQRAKHITSVWGYEEARAMAALDPDRERTRTVPSVPKEVDLPAIRVVLIEPDKMQETLGGILVDMYVPSSKMDVVSWVSALFVTSGNPLEVESEVLCQSPARVKVSARVKGTGFHLGYAVSTNKSLAKVNLYEALKERMLMLAERVRNKMEELNRMADEAILVPTLESTMQDVRMENRNGVWVEVAMDVDEEEGDPRPLLPPVDPNYERLAELEAELDLRVYSMGMDMENDLE